MMWLLRRLTAQEFRSGAVSQLTSSWLEPFTWPLKLSCRPPGPFPTSLSRCKDLSSCTCFVNWLSGFPADEHSALPKKDIVCGRWLVGLFAMQRKEQSRTWQCYRRVILTRDNTSCFYICIPSLSESRGFSIRIVIVIETILLLKQRREQYAHHSLRNHLRHLEACNKHPPSSPRTEYSHCQLPLRSLPLSPLAAPI